MDKPVIYILDNGGEAYDVRYFCSALCRSKFDSEKTERIANGISGDYIADTVCDKCGKKLEEPA